MSKSTGHKKSPPPKRPPRGSDSTALATQQLGEALLSTTRVGWLVLVCLLLPTFMENGYLNITRAKTDCFLVGALLLLLPAVAGLSIAGHWKLLIPDSLPGYAFLGLGGTALLSALLSGDFGKSFLGYDGWGIGALAPLLLYFFASLLKDGVVVRPWQVIPAGLWLSVLLGIGILHAAGIDCFSLHANIIAKQFYDYVSTFGNNNWLAGFLCLLFPYAAGRLLFTKKKELPLCAIFTLLVSLASVLCGSDGLLLGLGTMLLFALPVFCSDRARLLRALAVAITLLLELGICGVLPCFAKKIAKAGGWTEKLANPAIAFPLAGFLMVLLLAAILLKGEKAASCLRKGIFFTGIVSWCGAVFFFFVDTVRTFGDSWGTYRGLIWCTGWEAFGAFPFYRKLLGVGPGMLRDVFSSIKSGGLTVLAAHSEVLQLLLTQGILGLGCWLLFWGSLTALYFHRKMWNRPGAAFFLACIAYWGQSLVTSPVIMNLAPAITLAALFLAEYRKSDRPVSVN